jgi:FKBP-type peptidyl-prolyl cis-trans isomerase
VRRSLTLPLVLASVLASTLVLAGCAGDPSTGSTPEATPVAEVDVCETSAGDGSAAVSVTGDFGTAPTVEFTAPLEVETTQRTVVIEGETVGPGAPVGVAYTLYNGTTGEAVETYGYADGESPVGFRADLATLQEGFARTIACLGVGSRAVGVIPAAEGFADAGVDGFAEDDTVVFVVDILQDLAPTEWTTDVPTIGGTDDAPTVTLPATAPKTDLELVVLTEGDGAVVGGADDVTVHYLGTAWETGLVFDQSYTRGQPSTFSVTGVVEGFSAALIGQRVGSRVLVTMPPSMGYGEAGTSTHELAGLTLVFLIDIVSTAPAS